MDPVNRPLYCYNFHRSVLQIPDVIVLHQEPVNKRFSLDPPEKSEKTKKDLEKKKDQKKKQENKDDDYPYRN